MSLTPKWKPQEKAISIIIIITIALNFTIDLYFIAFMLLPSLMLLLLL